VKQPIIEQPGKQKRLQRYVGITLTLAFWVIWGYLLFPIVRPVAEAMGINLASSVIPVTSGTQDILGLLAWFVGMILLIGTVTAWWALRDQMRYAHHERRHQPADIEQDRVAGHFGIESPNVAMWHCAKRLVVRHDSVGNIAQVLPRCVHPQCEHFREPLTPAKKRAA